MREKTQRLIGHRIRRMPVGQTKSNKTWSQALYLTFFKEGEKLVLALKMEAQEMQLRSILKWTRLTSRKCIHPWIKRAQPRSRLCNKTRTECRTRRKDNVAIAKDHLSFELKSRRELRKLIETLQPNQPKIAEQIHWELARKNYNRDVELHSKFFHNPLKENEYLAKTWTNLHFSLNLVLTKVNCRQIRVSSRRMPSNFKD